MIYYAIITHQYGMEPMLHATTDAAIKAADELSTLSAYRDSMFIIVRCHIWIDNNDTANSEVTTVMTINARNT
jgi:hypothetical protein